MMTIFTLFERGGIVMYPIALCSFFSLFVFFERLWFLNRKFILPEGLSSLVQKCVMENNDAEAIQLCASRASPLSDLLGAVLKKTNEPPFLIKDHLEDLGREQIQRLEKNIGVLGVIASIAPLLGILGTVLGMIQSFQNASLSGFTSPVDMASGVWQALLTTAYGVGVGIIATLFYRYLLARVDGFALLLEKESQHLIDIVSIRSAKVEKN